MNVQRTDENAQIGDVADVQPSSALELFEPVNVEHKEVTAQERVVRAVERALQLAVDLDNHPNLERSKLEPLFTYHMEVLREVLEAGSLFEAGVGIVGVDTYFVSNFDAWSRLDLPRITGEIDSSNREHPKRSIRLHTAYCAPSYADHILPDDPEQPDLKYYTVSIEEDRTVRLLRPIYNGEVLELKITNEQLDCVAEIFESVPDKLVRRAYYLDHIEPVASPSHLLEKS